MQVLRQLPTLQANSWSPGSRRHQPPSGPQSSQLETLPKPVPQTFPAEAGRGEGLATAALRAPASCGASLGSPLARSLALCRERPNAAGPPRALLPVDRLGVSSSEEAEPGVDPEDRPSDSV